MAKPSNGQFWQGKDKAAIVGHPLTHAGVLLLL
jgi:hypothetical protein